MEETKKHRTCLFSSWREPTSAPSGPLLPEEGGRRGKNPSTPFLWKGDARRAGGWPKEKRAKPASVSSADSFQRKEEVCRLPVSSFRAKARNLFRLRSDKRCEDSGKRETPCFMRLGITVLHADGFTKGNGNWKRKRSLGCARDDETGKRFPPIPFQPTGEANLRSFGPPPSRGRREIRECPFPVSSFRANARNLFRSRSGEAVREAGNGKHRSPHIGEANLRPFGAPPSRGRRENALFPYRHFERKREIFFVRGQISAVRRGDHGKHRTLYDFISLRK